jgi:hypothetical protein
MSFPRFFRDPYGYPRQPWSSQLVVLLILSSFTSLLNLLAIDPGEIRDNKLRRVELQ